MLKDEFPRVHERYSSLPVLGSILDGFLGWLVERGYTRLSVRMTIRTMRRVDESLRRRSVRNATELTREAVLACVPKHSQEDRILAGAVHALERYLDRQGLLAAPVVQQSRAERQVELYKDYLERERGLSAVTIAHHLRTAGELLAHIGYNENTSRLSDLTLNGIETLVGSLARRRGREAVQHSVSQLRSFLRFLAGREEVPSGLHMQLDSPRVYRGERLPRALPWETVCAFLGSIDRDSLLGLRDHVIFLLIATYGLRSSEIVGLTLGDIDWRNGTIQVHQRKTASPILLPLTDEVGTHLIEYLRKGRPTVSCREIFLKLRAPSGVLKPYAVNQSFGRWSKLSGLSIPFHGPHCLRHSYAVHLLRQGTSLKTIGDILGHRSAESTQVYLRLSLEDLRGVALSLPRDASPGSSGEVHS